MGIKHNHWQSLFIFCLGLFLGTAFCMKCMEAEFRVNRDEFTIIELELFYSKQKVAHILSSLDYRVQTILKYHLIFDFAFMAGVYPAITSLCMMSREKVNAPSTKKVLYFFAALQLIAWFADIVENLWLLQWVGQASIGNEFAWYHATVLIKWIIALAGATLAISIMIRKKKNFYFPKTLFFF